MLVKLYSVLQQIIFISFRWEKFTEWADIDEIDTRRIWLHHKLSFYSELSSRTEFFFLTLDRIPSSLTLSHTYLNKLKHRSVIIVKITQLWHIFSAFSIYFDFWWSKYDFSLLFPFFSLLCRCTRCPICKCSWTEIHKKLYANLLLSFVWADVELIFST